MSILLSFFQLHAQVRTLDEFETKENWNFIRSDGVNLNLGNEAGLSGKAIRFDYDFTKGTGYGGIQKFFAIDLPENFEFTFWVKANSPDNNFEIKFIDSTGNNVWWVSNRNYDFPEEWKKIRIKKRHISFAWGPTNNQSLKRIDRIEFTVASFVGGKGTLWLDDLKFEPLPPETDNYPQPLFSATSLLPNQHILVDFKQRREFGGVHINWMKGASAKAFDILLSNDGNSWENVYQVLSNSSDISFIRLPESEARYLKILIHTGNSPTGSNIQEVRFPDVKSTLTLNDFLMYSSKHSTAGDYPRYFSGQASYWTLTGVNNDVKEALINEEGMVEVEKARFSIEPMLKSGETLYNWSNVKTQQSLGTSGKKGEFEFVPAATWLCPDVEFTTGITTSGEANKNSVLNIQYTLKNLSSQAKDVDLFLLIRPYQVNPYYQFLNLPGGAGKISTISEKPNGAIAVDDKLILTQKKYDAFGVCASDEGNVVDFIRNGILPAGKSITDKQGLAQGILQYRIHLQAGEKQMLTLVVPFYGEKVPDGAITTQSVLDESSKTTAFWNEKTGHIRFNLPPSANRIMDAYRSNLAYILVNRDHAGIQPGSRSYERSWIRDGALTSSALLKSGIVREVRDFIDWYTDHLYENGKVPCVVDFRGPDPVPENDSHGELIYLLREYFNFTQDTAYLRSKNHIVLNVTNYIGTLIAERSTPYYRDGNDSLRAFYGLVPESISHEGYSAKPMHSYWDNFFTLKGLKDATEIQKILGETESYERIRKMRDTFRENLYASINLAMKNHKINYIPGCAELGDFDATSTTIALTPCNELGNLPKPQVFNTFEKYYEFFKNRRDGTLNWVNYTPYENRLIGSFIQLDQPERAHELIEFFLNDQRPQGWHHWAEVVWRDYRIPRYIGDMPHTWVGSDFINAIRSMFVYENEADQTLVLSSALYQDWIDAPEGMSVEHLPTYYGEISYAVKKTGNTYHFSISGGLSLPSGGMVIRNFNGSKMPVMVKINGKEIKGYTQNEIRVPGIPAEVEIRY